MFRSPLWLCPSLLLSLSFFGGLAYAQEVVATRVATGLARPLYATAPQGDPDRLFILEQRGQIRILDLVENRLLDQPFMVVPVSLTGNERGLLGMAFHPDYAQNGFFYLCYTRGTQGNTIISRFQVSADPNVASLDSERELLNLPQPVQNHNGGWLDFGPDGMLYVALGDGGGAGDPFNNGQDPQTLLGNILRLEVLLGEEAPYYQVPQDNPFLAGNGDDRIWAWGLRNPWRCSFDRETGDLWIADVGQDNREEINFQPASSSGGENYGWNVMEGELCFSNPNLCDDPSFTAPIYTYDHGFSTTSGESVTGGYVYRGPIESLQGHYFFGDFVSSRIWSFRTDGQQVLDFTDWTETLQPDAGSLSGIASFGEDAVGNLYITAFSGDVFRLESNLPVVSIEGPDTGVVGEFLRYTATADEDIASWDWDIGNSIPLPNDFPSIVVGYNQPGDYLIEVTATTPDGRMGSATKMVTISETGNPFPDATITTIPVGPTSAYVSWHFPLDEPVDGFLVTWGRSLAETNSTFTRRSSIEVDNLVIGEAYRFQVRAMGPQNQALGLIIADYTHEADQRYHLRFPHVAQNEQWWTGLVLVNPGQEATDIDFKVIGMEDGLPTMTTLDARLGAGDKSIGLASDFLTPELIAGAQWLDIVSDQPLLGFELFGQRSSIMSGMEVNGRQRQWGILPHADTTAGYVGISLVNSSETETAAVSFTGYSGTGVPLATAESTIPALGKKVDLVENLFGEEWDEDIRTVVWNSNRPLTGFEIWGDHQTTFQSGMTTTHPGFIQGILPVIEENALIQFTDTSGRANNLELKFYNNEGTLVSTIENRLEPNSQLKVPIEFFFEAGFRGWLHVTAEGTVQGHADLRRVRADGPLAEAVPMQMAQQPGTAVVFPHTANPEQWTTELILVNGNDPNNALTLTAHDENGDQLDSVERVLPANGRLFTFARDLFEDLPTNVAYVRAQAQLDGLVAHLLYYTNQGGGHIMGGTIVRPLR